MATITVTTASDVVNANDGVLSLREAVAQANATTALDQVRFAASLEGATLMLTGGELVVNQDLAIDGDVTNGGPEITLSGGGASRILNVVGTGTDVALNDMVLSSGGVATYGDDGGAVRVGGGKLTISRCTVEGGDLYPYSSVGGGVYAADGSSVSILESRFINNYAYGGGGAIAGGANVSLVISDSEFQANNTMYSGGAILLKEGGSLRVEASVFHDNEAGPQRTYGGGICLEGGTATIDQSTFTENGALQGGAIWGRESQIIVTDSRIADNTAGSELGQGGGVYIHGGTLAVLGSSIVGNTAIVSGYSDGPVGGGGIWSRDSVLTIDQSTIAGNSAIYAATYGSAAGGGIYAAGSGSLTIRNSTITGNHAEADAAARGGGIHVGTIPFDIANSIIAGNSVLGSPSGGRDIFGTITLSNGHNLFGTAVAGDVSGDRENVAPSALFAAVDPATGGGLVGANDAVTLANRVTNPALSGGDLLAALPVDQLGAPRPRPTVTLPDIGAAESTFAPSKVASANNDVLTGNGNRNTISGLAGHDYIRGLGGNDTLRGNDGGDLLDGGAGNDTLDGGAGFDLALFGGSTAVVVDLSRATGTARRGSETDRLISNEGAIGSSAADIFRGDGGRNFFQGGAGKDTYTLGGGRDLVDFDVADHSGLGSSRDVVTDFTHLVDRIDLSGIDADVTSPGNQAFRWIGSFGLGTTPGTLSHFVDGYTTVVRGSTDTDNRAEFQIALVGLVTLTSDDFYL